MHYIRKHVKGNGMQGIKVARPPQLRKLTSSKRTVSRAYGGVHTAGEVKERIMRAFLIEEFKRFKNLHLNKSADKKDKKKKKTADKKKVAKK